MNTPLNANLITEFRDIALAAEYYGMDQISTQFNVAADAISIFPDTISIDLIPGRDGIMSVPGIGDKMIDRIAAWLETGNAFHNQKISQFRQSAKFSSYKNLLPVLGVGPVSARKFVDAGIEGVTDLRGNSSIKLTRIQSLGVKWHAELSMRIPRDEIADWARRAEEHWHKITGPGHTFEVVGSYRRLAESSGDIDVLVSGPESHLLAFAKWCEDQPGFIATLVAGNVRISFLARLKSGGPVRQVDLLYAPPEERALAELYFTGSALFNISMRRIAKMAGLLLNQRYLGPADGSNPLVCPDEAAIFGHLNLEWVEPKNRNIPIK